MASKIDNSTPVPSPAGLTAGRPVNRAGNDSSEPVSAPTASDRLQLSGEAAGMIAAQRELAGTPPAMDKAKIDALRADISAGTYRIDPEEIAARLIALERKLA